jgi:hypothetical protein
MAKPNPMGATFAERAAASQGQSTFTDPTPKPGEAAPNTTFAERAKAGTKQVKSSENKAVQADDAEEKKPAKKTAAKKG